MVKALAKELILRKGEIHTPIETIYFGGGTPSLLSAIEIDFLLQTIDHNYEITSNPEITLEANPDDLTKQKIIELANSKINRLSIGVQSFFNDDLKLLNRAHNATEAINSLKIATKYFDNITIDLIYGIPNLDEEKWQKNLQITFDLDVNHISSYALTVEPKTALFQLIKEKKYPKLDEELALAHFNILVEETQKENYLHYEVSNFAKEGYISKHNSAYWNGINYIGIGPSAHSFNGKMRSWNINNNTKYIKALQENNLPSQQETLSKTELYNETIMIGLRTSWGISLNDIELKFGKKIKETLLQNIKKHLKNKTLQLINNQLSTTKKGKFLIDGIASDLFFI